MKEAIKIQEVIARDGFQIEERFIPTDEKITLIDALSECGLAKIEITSFVSPKAVPQLRDATEVANAIKRNPNITYVALVANVRGAERALDVNMDEINVVMSASATHNMKNVNKTNEQSLQEIKEIITLTKGTSMQVNGSIATSFGCPFEGKVSERTVLDYIDKYIALGINSITLADTTGMANPRQVYELVKKINTSFATMPLTLHFHNTRGMGMANVLAAMEAGATQFDSSLGGLGGCPFAPGATGNICTEDLVHMLDEMGIKHDTNLDKLIALSKQLPPIIGRDDLPGQIVKAGKTTDLHPV